MPKSTEGHTKINVKIIFEVVKMIPTVINSDCEVYLSQENKETFDLSFLDPPFNQGKFYRNHNDNLSEEEYWNWMGRVCKLIYDQTSEGGAIYFMQREKNTEQVLECLRSAGWNYRNLIIWKKKSSAVPCNTRYGLQYQIIAYFIKGSKPRLFNKLRIDPPLLVTEKKPRLNGMYVTDVWDDIRELTSGFFAGDEPLRDDNKERAHKQQSPVQLLTRIILSSTNCGDVILDPFAGTGTTLVVSQQLKRKSIGIELDHINVDLIKDRLLYLRKSDNIERFRKDYTYTSNLNEIWPKKDSLF